jgi:D-3-phosphoglycerate dehydrogenase
VLAANHSPIAETVSSLTEFDRMLPLCDTVLIACGLAPETRGLIDGRRLALMKLGALLINVARAPIVDEMPSSTHSKTATLAEPRSMDGGNTPPPPSRTADRRADRSMNCPMC